MRLGYGTGDGLRSGHRGPRGRYYGNGGHGSIDVGLNLGLSGGLYATAYGRFGYGHRQDYYYRRYGNYRRCYTPIYGTYGSLRYPYYGGYGYDPYYSYATVFDYGYRPLLRPVYDTTIIYAQGAESIPPAVTEAYYTSPPQPAVMPTQPQAPASQPLDAAAPDPVDAVLPGSTPAQEVTSWVELAGTAFAAGRYEEARHLYMRAVLADDDDGFAKLFYGLANFATGDYGAAATALRRALQYAPELVDNPVDLRTIYADESALEAQLVQLGELVDSHPGDQEARFLLGYMYYATGKPQKALTILQSAAESSPEDALVAFVRDAATRVVNLMEEEDKP